MNIKILYKIGLMSFAILALTGCKDSFLEVGKGFGATYSSLWPMLRIDYILYPKTLEARWYARDDVKYSDHYPILSSFLQ